jgi:CheY-like chemotaxis protein
MCREKMRVIVIDDRKQEREGLVLALQKASLSVEGAVDGKTGVDAIAREPASVALVAWPASGGTDLVQLLRGADPSGRMFIVAILDPNAGGRDIPAVLGAGVHDFLRRPISVAELLARTSAPERLLKWATSVAKPGLIDLSNGPDLARTATWKNMAALVAEDLGALVGQIAMPVAGWPKAFGRELRGASITMSLAADQIEIRITVMGDRPALRWLGEVILGDAASPEAALDDVLREFANTAGGAVKRAALPENVTLTTGIPTNVTSIRTEGSQVQSWTIPLDGGKANLALLGEIRKRENQRVPVSDLREGMVLAHDLRTDSGALLVTAGSRLTSTTAERLSQVLGPRFFVEVATAA